MARVAILALLSALPSLVHAQIAPIHTSGARPLNAAIQLLEKATHTPIFYEELPHEHPSTLISGAERGMNPAYMYLRGGHLDVDFANVSGDPFLATEALLNAYRAQQLPGEYTVAHTTDAITVLPLSMLNRSGATVSVASLLERRITLPVASRTPEETFAAICEALQSATHQPIKNLSEEKFKEASVRFGADDEAALSVLLRLSKVTGPFSAHLLYEPHTGLRYMVKDAVPPAEPTSAIAPTSTLSILNFDALRIIQRYLDQPQFLDLAGEGLEVMILPPAFILFLVAIFGLAHWGRMQRPFRNHLWKPHHWWCWTHLLIYAFVIAIGVIYKAQNDAPHWRPDPRGEQWLNVLFCFSLASIAFWTWRMKGFRRFAVCLLLLLEVPILGALSVAGMSVSGDWL